MKFTRDGIAYQLLEPADLSWLAAYGTVFCAFDQNDSGNLCFGVQGTARYFIKIAGVRTLHAAVTPEEAKENLRQAIPLYRELAHPHLIRLIEAKPFGALVVAVFSWCEGECLFDHWNFDRYAKNPQLQSPMARFQQLPVTEKLRCTAVLFSFLKHTVSRNYRAVDFYDGSILYDFQAKETTICDIDLFCPAPLTNPLGVDFWGSRRLKAPEEYELGAVIDERTHVFTLGALLFHLFGSYSAVELKQMAKNCAFFPCSPEGFSLSNQHYAAACRAVSPNRDARFSTLQEFESAWNDAKTVDRKNKV